MAGGGLCWNRIHRGFSFAIGERGDCAGHRVGRAIDQLRVYFAMSFDGFRARTLTLL